jgi:hypothetical protein
MRIASKYNKFGYTSLVATLALYAVIGGVACTAHAQTAVGRVIADFEMQCDALYAENPDLDMGAEPSVPRDFKVEPSLIYDLPITPSGQTATIVHAGFSCGWFGMAWCGMAGCGSFLVVGEQVFEWETISFPPEAIGNNSNTLLIAPIKGFNCKDSNAMGGYGVDPCFKSAVWDETGQTFMTTDGSVKLRQDLSR